MLLSVIMRIQNKPEADKRLSLIIFLTQYMDYVPFLQIGLRKVTFSWLQKERNNFKSLMFCTVEKNILHIIPKAHLRSYTYF